MKGDLRLALAIEKQAANARQQHWNSIVSRKAVFISEDPTHYTVLHPTKGFRRISKRRLGELPA